MPLTNLNINSSPEDRFSVPKTKQPLQLSPREIAEKYKPLNSEIVHEVVQADFWNAKKVIIAFYETIYAEEDYINDRQFVEAYLLVPGPHNNYSKILITKFEDDNVHTEIRSVFFANADRDKAKELIIISTCQHRLQYLYDGYEYQTVIFDDVDLAKKKLAKSLESIDDIGNKLNGFEGFLDDNPNSKARFKNADQVKRELKRLGF